MWCRCKEVICYCDLYVIPGSFVFWRDQSCTDILDLYHRLRCEVSSGEEAEVSHSTWHAVFVISLYAAYAHLGFSFFRLSWMLTRTLRGHLQDIGLGQECSTMQQPVWTVPLIQLLSLEAAARVYFIFSSQQGSGSASNRGVPLNAKVWRGQCQQLLRQMIVSPDSEPFRQPVDLFEYPVK